MSTTASTKTTRSKRLKQASLVVGMGLIILLLVNAWVTSRSTEPARGGIGELVSAPGGALHVRQDGPADASPIVLLHGLAGSMHAWDRMVPALAARYRVIRIDLLGHGGSAKPRDGYRPDAQARGVAAVLDRLQVDRALVVGHSLGGTVSVSLAAQRPGLARALVVIGAAPRDEFVSLPMTARLLTLPVLGPALYRLGSRSQVRSGLQDAFAEGVRVPERLVEDFERTTYSSYDASYSEGRAFLKSNPAARQLRGSGVALLSIFGSADKAVDPAANRVWASIPRARIRLLNAVGHSPHLERPQQVVSEIKAFDRGLAPAGP